MTKNKRKRGASVIGWLHWVLGNDVRIDTNIKNKMMKNLVKDYKEFDGGMAALTVALYGVTFIVISLLWLIPMAFIFSAEIVFLVLIIGAVFGFWYPWYLLYVGLHSDELADE